MLLSKICKIHCRNVYFLLMASRKCAFHVSSSVPFAFVMCKTLFPPKFCYFVGEMFPAYMGSIVLKARSMQNHGKHPNCPPPFMEKCQLGPPKCTWKVAEFIAKMQMRRRSIILEVHGVTKHSTNLCSSCLRCLWAALLAFRAPSAMQKTLFGRMLYFS